MRQFVTSKFLKRQGASSQPASHRSQPVLADNRPQPSALSRQSAHPGLPLQLKQGIEQLSGHSLADVRVNYNSSRPARLGAFAYTAGNQIHVAPGQERHLPHEAWHVVQQKQGRVRATTVDQQNNSINDDPGLEREADVMGQRALNTRYAPVTTAPVASRTAAPVVQAKINIDNVNHVKAGMPPVHGFSGLNSSGGGPASITVTGMKGTSSPADPPGMSAAIRPYLKDPAKSNAQTLTRMHAIRGRFGGPSASNNMFLGTALSNNFSSNSHYRQVEKPLENFVTGKPKGRRAFDYRVYPNAGHIPGYMQDRISDLSKKDQGLADQLRNFASKHVPDGFHCEATLYDDIDPVAQQYKEKQVGETVQTTVGVTGAVAALPGAGMLATAHDSGLLHAAGAALAIGLLPAGIGIAAGALGYTAVAAAAGAFSGYHALISSAAGGLLGGLYGYHTAEND